MSLHGPAARTLRRSPPQIATCAPAAPTAAAPALPSPRLAAATSAVWPRRPRSIRLWFLLRYFFLDSPFLVSEARADPLGAKRRSRSASSRRRRRTRKFIVPSG